MTTLSTLTSLLGQLRTAPPPEALPSPPFLEHTLFESPWGAAATLLGIGLACLFALNRSGRPRQGLVMLGTCAALAAVLVAVASSVTTDRERVMAMTRDLVTAVGRGDGQSAGRHLVDRPQIRVLGLSRDWDRDDLVERIDRYLGDRGVWRLKDREARVRTLRASADSPGVIRTQVRVWAHPEQGFPSESWWLVTWRQPQTGGPWRVTELDVQQIEGVAPGTRID